MLSNQPKQDLLYMWIMFPISKIMKGINLSLFFFISSETEQKPTSFSLI